MAVIDLESLLKQYGLEAVGPIEKLSADSVNETFHVSTNEGEFTVRLYQPGRERNEILYDHSVLRYLAERNFPVPSIVQSKQGETVVSFNQSFAAAFNYLPGKTLARAEIHENNVQSVGETLAWFHGILDDFESEFSKPSHDVEGVRKLLQQHTQELLAMQYPDVGALVEELGQALQRFTFPETLPAGVVHSDLHEGNILFRQGEVSGVLDFDRCYEGMRIIDVASQIVWWCFRDANFNLTLYQAFWEGYISQRSVTAEEREYFWPALHFSLLRMILRKLLAESEGRREETYGEMSATQNTDYFRKVFQNSLSNKELIISHIPKA